MTRAFSWKLLAVCEQDDTGLCRADDGRPGVFLVRVVHQSAACALILAVPLYTMEHSASFETLIPELYASTV